MKVTATMTGFAASELGRHAIATVRVLTLIGMLSLAAAARAEPIELKLSFFTSDRSNVFQCQIKPFVHAVNAEGSGMVRVKVYFSGSISSVLTDQPKLVAEGVADLALVVPGYSPQQFPDSSVMELPGLFRDERESSLVFTRLAKAGAFAGYKEFFVAGAFVSAGESIHSRNPIATLADLKGQSIRVNNSIEGETLRMLGAQPFLLPINQTMDDLSTGKLDGVTIPPSMLFEFGFGRLTRNHYLIHLGGAPVALVMNRAKFERLPAPAQTIVRKYSGDWLAEREAACFDAKNRETIVRLRADPRRKVIDPSPADRMESRRVFASAVEIFVAQSAHNRELLNLVRTEIARLRASN